MANKLCPFDWEHGACREHACALFVNVQYQNAQGETREDWACVFVAGAKLQLNAVMEQGRTQASLDKVATGLGQGFTGLLQLAGKAAQARALVGEKGSNGA